MRSPFDVSAFCFSSDGCRIVFARRRTAEKRRVVRSDGTFFGSRAHKSRLRRCVVPPRRVCVSARPIRHGARLSFVRRKICAEQHDCAKSSGYVSNRARKFFRSAAYIRANIGAVSERRQREIRHGRARSFQRKDFRRRRKIRRSARARSVESQSAFESRLHFSRAGKQLRRLRLYVAGAALLFGRSGSALYERKACRDAGQAFSRRAGGSHGG